MELILFAMISLIVIVAMLASRLNDNSFPFPFDKKESLFTPAEKNFQNLLEQALGGKYRIINRVKLADLVTIRNGVSSRAGQAALTNAESKYLDFAICDNVLPDLTLTVDAAVVVFTGPATFISLAFALPLFLSALNNEESTVFLVSVFLVL